MTPLDTISASSLSFSVLRDLGSGLFQDSSLVERDGDMLILRLYRQEFNEQFDAQWERWKSSGLGSGHHDLIGYEEVGEREGRPYLIRRWVEGTAFFVFARSFKFDARHPEDALEVGQALCRAVASLHMAGLAHGHLSNDNVFFGENGAPIVVDAWMGHISPKTAYIAQHKPGSRASVAPEQTRAGGAVDPRTDVWQLGLLLARLYTRKPDLAVTPRILMELHQAKLPMALIRVIWQAISDEPENRFRDAEVLATALSEVPLQDHQRTVYVRPAPPAPGVRDGLSPVVRNALIFISGVLVVMIAAWALSAYRTEPDEAVPTAVTASEEPARVENPMVSESSMSEQQLLRPRFVFKTNVGSFVIEAIGDRVPIATLNFAKHVDDGTYEGVIFDRVISNFVVQGGQHTLEGGRVSTPRPRIRNEWLAGGEALPGTVGMSRLPSEPDSIRSTFFINMKDNRQVFGTKADGIGEVIFGRVVDGIDVVQIIAKSPTNDKYRPYQPIYIETARWADGFVPEDVFSALEKRQPQVIELPSGVSIKDIVVGRGQPFDSTRRLTIHYVASANEEKYDSSRDRETPQTFLPGALPPGMEEGLADMRTGGRRIITVPPELGYRERGAAGIPPNATLTYDVHLIAQR